MKKLLMIVLLLQFFSPLFAADPREQPVIDKVNEAIKYAKDHGANALIDEVNKPDGAFIYGTKQYLYITQFDGTYKAHPFAKALLAKNLITVKAPDGFELGKAVMKKAAQGGGWIDYNWKSPSTQTVVAKRAYIARAKGMGSDGKSFDLIIGSGYDK